MAKRKKAGPRGISLHIGLNSVNPDHYDGWDGKLAACESDAKDMQAIAKKQSFASTLLLTRKATYKAVSEAISEAATKLRTGDIFLLTYSGHGGQVPDGNRTEEEDGKDETWVLYDRQLIDDELYALWGQFEAGVRVFMLSDSCHSGSVARAAVYGDLAATPKLAKAFPKPRAQRFRAMPTNVANRTYAAHRKLYDGIQREHPAGERAAVGASVLLISGCQDNQLSSDGDRNGLFTGTLRTTWKNGAFAGGYRTFHKEIGRQMPPWQTPNYFRTGLLSPVFERQRPFTV
jgi:hypothetical protein